jgi:hypothetical protein
MRDDLNAPPEKPLRKKLETLRPQKPRIAWHPTFSLKLGYLHLWLGKQESDGRSIYVLVEQTSEFRFDLKLHWLTQETPMIGLYVYPTLAAFFLWTHSHDVTKGRE